jgi:hypothetical protein
MWGGMRCIPCVVGGLRLLVLCPALNCCMFGGSGAVLIAAQTGVWIECLFWEPWKLRDPHPHPDVWFMAC